MPGAIDQSVANVLIAGLQRIGYVDARLERNYVFPDWFADKQLRTVDAAAFGQTPPSYETACIGVATANGLKEQKLVNAYRALGAPLLLEIDNEEVREWSVSRLENNHALIGRYRSDELGNVIAERAKDWTPDSLLRAKNIGSFKWVEQLGLFSGLIPELENQIQEKLDPLLRDTLSRTREAYVDSTRRAPDVKDLYKLVFWILTAKVFRDRRVKGFVALTGDADAILSAVAEHYRTEPPKLLNREARQTAATSVWRELDFRNLSVDVLAHIWSRTLVDRDTRKRLGIHRTSRAIVRYIVEQIPFAQVGDDRIVYEPCSGSAAFLIGALNHLRSTLHMASPQERHQYFVKHLVGTEYDSFGVEISMLALTLADFPNPNGWEVRRADVFAPETMTPYLKKAGVVLCNPPFESFTDKDKTRYEAQETRKPAELLRRVLSDLHPQGVLGFVLPYNAVDGRGYATSRRLLSERFASVELTVLPERSFEDAETDIALLIAKEPIPHAGTRVTFRRVLDNELAWEQFKREHAVSSSYVETFTVEHARKGWVLADLPEVWSYLADFKQLGEIADIHRGLEWNRPITEGLHIRSKPAPGYVCGVAPSTKFNTFQVPVLAYLNALPNQQRRNGWQHPWAKPKAILPKARVSRGHWRLVAFADRDGVACHHTFYGVWPKTKQYDEVILAAILNSPVANAFVATREGNRDVTKEVLELIPVPSFSPSAAARLRALVSKYEASIKSLALETPDDPEQLLRQIDATVLDGYHMPPRIERQLLDYFNDNDRRVQHPFHNYYPATFDTYVSLSTYLDPRFGRSTLGELLRRAGGQ